MLKVTDCKMHFGGIQALSGVTLSVEKDSITAIIGPNGAGKTTLFNCITGFYRATAGSIVFEGHGGPVQVDRLLGTWDRKHPFASMWYQMFGGSYLVARAGIGRTFQNIRLFDEMTVLENCLVAQHTTAHRQLLSGLLNTASFRAWERSAIDRAYQWLGAFSLANCANTLAGQLSYGQRRRCEIARALCMQPKLLCLDEPAAGLNPQETAALKADLLRVRKKVGLTILLIEHDMPFVMDISDTIHVLDGGQTIASGPPSQVRVDPKVRRAYLG